MRVSVIIPTTDGPSRLLHLAPLQKAPRSVMRTQDDYRPLPVSAAYQAFAAPGGPLDMAFGLQASAFDLRLSARIDSGRSWELPVALAHWLQAQGHELSAQAPDRVLWATGALDLDMGVIAQDYHLAAKLAGSRDVLNAAAAQGCTVSALLPGPASAPEGLSDRITLTRVNSFSQAITALEPLMGAGKAQASVTRRSTGGRRHLVALSGVAGLAVLAALALLAPEIRQAWAPGPLTENTVLADDNNAALAGSESAEEPAEESTAASTEVSAEGPAAAPESQTETQADIEAEADAPAPWTLAELPALVLMRPGADASCISVHFGGATPQREHLPATSEGFEEASLERLCGIGLALPEAAGAALNVVLPETLLPHVMPSDHSAEMTLAPGEDRVLALTGNLPDVLDLLWQITDEAGATHALTHRLTMPD